MPFIIPPPRQAHVTDSTETDSDDGPPPLEPAQDEQHTGAELVPRNDLGTATQPTVTSEDMVLWLRGLLAATAHADPVSDLNQHSRLTAA